MMEFFMHYIMVALMVSVPVLFILLVKRGMKKYISIRCQYNISILSMILLVMPLLPVKWLAFLNRGYWLNSGLIPQAAGFEGIEGIRSEPISLAADMGWLQDFAVSVERTALEPAARALMMFWLIGMAAAAVLILKCSLDLKLMKESVVLAGESRIAAIFFECKNELKVNRKIICGTSILVRSPVTVGLFRPLIILPAGPGQELTEDEVHYILLHEITHCKNGDILLNHIMCLFQIIYWYNPLVFLLSKVMRLEREMACDASVINDLPVQDRLLYGKTLLRFTRAFSNLPVLSLSMDWGGSKELIKRRLENIVSFRAESAHERLKSIITIIFTGIVIAGQIPLLSVLASAPDNQYEFQGVHVVYEDLSAFFDGLDGTFVLYNLETDQYTIYNQERSVKRVSPASTYKIYSALIAMDKGIISAKHSGQQWNGINYPFTSWNQDQNLKTAIQNSVSWYFQELDKQVGRKALESYYTELSYGNHDLSGNIDSYWMESSLRISPVEQVELLTKFYKNETIFQTGHVEAVKESLRLSEKDGAVLSGKTGSTAVNGKGVAGWFIGYVETKGGTFLFAVRVEGDDGVAGSTAVEITQSILKEILILDF